MPDSLYTRYGKRLCDAVLATLGLVALFPVFVLVALMVRLSSPGPVVFRQRRIGQRGTPFEILKFRSMCRDAELQGPTLTRSGDPRVTKVGAILRRTKLDELPQLWNVLRGDMSLVGPRPELPCYVALYDPEELQVLDLRPGISDPASIRYRHEESLLAESPDPERLYRDVVMKRKLALNLYYRRRLSLTYDLRILWQTVFQVARLKPAPDQQLNA